MTFSLRFFVFLTCLFVFQQVAHAISITNLAKTSHQIAVRAPGNQVSVVEIAPGSTVYLNVFPEAGLKLLTLPGSGEMTARELDNFTLWPDGSFGPQIRRRQRSIDNH